jgi:HEAT repeat protein
MRKTPKGFQESMLKAAGIGLVVLIVLGTLALSSAPCAGAPRALSTAVQAADSLDAILKDLANYKYDEGVGPFTRLRAYVQAHKTNPAERKDCEAKLLAFLQTDPAPGGVMAACRSLSLIGSAASAPVLEAMLVKPETTDPARYALERIPGDEVDQALLRALAKTQGDVRRGITSTLGIRACAAAVPALERLASGNDAETALDAVNALGKIGTDDAVRAVEASLAKSGGRAKSVAASALLMCADRRMKAGEPNEAAGLYDKLLAAGLPDIERQAAFRGRVMAAGSVDDDGFILKALSGNDTVLYEPAIALVPKAFEASEIPAVLPFLEKLTESGEVELLAVLAHYPADVVLPSILKAAASPSPVVRMEALRSIGKVGNASVVGMLAARSASAVGDEQALTREVLSRLKGSDVDAEIRELLGKEADAGIKAELIQAVGARRIAAAKPALMTIVRSGAPALRLKAVQALEDVCTPADLRDLLALLFTIDDETAREEMQNTVASVALTITRPLARGDAAENLLAGEKDPRRVADLLRVLGKIGDDTALPAMRRALADPNKDVADAAVRGLADWPDVSAKDDVFAIAAKSDNLTYKVLALRAFVRMVGLEPYREPEAATADLEKALSLATRPEEKKLVLGLLPRFPCDKGLRIAESLQSDAAVAAEAKAAADRIKRSLVEK